MRWKRLLPPVGGLASVVLLVVVTTPFGTNCSNVALAVAPPSPSASSMSAGQLVTYFEKAGWSPNASGGIVGNMSQESNLSPTAAGGGLVQNIGSMWTQQATWDQQQNPALDPNGYAGQLGFLVYFVPRQSWWAQFNGAPTPQDAALWFQNGYEQCSGAGQPGTDQVGGGLCNPANRQAQAAAALAAAGGSSAVPVGASGGCGAAVNAAGYANPFALATALRPERIDMGVDYYGNGSIVAIGDAKIVAAAAGGTGWTSPTNTQACVYYQLLAGAYAGKFVYVCEDIVPLVTTGQTVKAGAPIATFIAASSTGIETGWGSGTAYEALAASLSQECPPPQDPGCASTESGNSFDRLLAALGAKPGVAQTQSQGGRATPAGYP